MTIVVSKKKSSNLLDRISESDQQGRYSVDVSHLDLDIWPAELLIVAQVKVIAAYKNKLTYIPSLSSFKFLQELDISRNMITSLDEIDFSKLIKLKHLDVSRNYLEQLPQEITQLPLLEELILHRNKLSSLPLDMKNLRALRKLDVSYNDITTVGAILELNDNLEDLNISNNDNLSRQNIGIKAGRLVDKRVLMSSKRERRLLITRALQVSRAVINKEQQVIFDEFHVKSVS